MSNRRERCSTWRWLALLVTLGVGLPVRADSVSVRGDLLAVGLGSRPRIDATDTRSRALLLQYIQLDAEDLVLDGIRVELVGVAGATIGESPDSEGEVTASPEGDVLVGTLSWQNRSRSISVRLGRQYLFAGGGRAEHLDGAAVTYRLWWVDLTAFGGRTHAWQWSLDDDDQEPQEPAFSSWAVGGRARLRLLDHGLASVAFLHEGDNGETARQLITFDAGYWRLSWLEALAGGVIDMVEGRPQELWAEIIARPVPGLKLAGGYTYLVPGLAIPKTSLFSIFSDDEYHDASAQAFYGFNRFFMAGLEGGLRYFPQRTGQELGYWVSARGRLALDRARDIRLGLKVEYHDHGDNRYVQGRLNAMTAFLERRLYCRADLFMLGLLSDNSGAGASAYQRAFSNKPLSVGGLGLIGWRFNAAWNANLAASVFSTARARSDVRVMGRLTYSGFWSWI